MVVYCAAVVAVFVWYIGEVLRALLEEKDPKLKEILRQVLGDLLETFRRGRRK